MADLAALARHYRAKADEPATLFGGRDDGALWRQLADEMDAHLARQDSDDMPEQPTLPGLDPVVSGATLGRTDQTQRQETQP